MSENSILDSGDEFMTISSICFYFILNQVREKFSLFSWETYCICILTFIVYLLKVYLKLFGCMYNGMKAQDLLEPERLDLPKKKTQNPQNFVNQKCRIAD